MTRQRLKPTLASHEIISIPANRNEETIDKSQKTIKLMHTLFKVTTCLYLSPSDRARSLSTHIAVSVYIDAEHKMMPEIVLDKYA